jgi:integrase
MAKGVEVREGKIRIWFMWKGVRCREVLPVPNSPVNLRYAERLRRDIVDKIRLGAFRYAEYFPNSPRCGADKSAPVTFGEYAQRYLKLRTDLAKSTLKSYRAALNSFWLPALGKMVLTKIVFTDVSTALAGTAWKSNKTRNNYLIVLRRVLDAAFVDGIIDRNPADRVRNAKVQQQEPDPLLLEEVELILGMMRERYHEHVVNYFEFAVFSGLRTSELIALEWGDVDFRRNQVFVRRAFVEGEVKTTKTSRIRHVDLNSRAKAALMRQKHLTFLVGGHVFLNPVTGAPWADDYRQRINYWHPTLKALGLRARDAYQTRHTYATLLLMSGANPAYVAQQLGHTTMKITLERYARWMPRADDGAEIAKFEARLSLENVPKVSRKNKAG